MSSNLKIAKNTLFLYFRMLVMMVISLFTSRVVLATLGVADYGIYNVVGGVVAMFGLFSGSITNSISRFLTFELGKHDYCQLKKVFSASLNVMFILSLLIFVIGEIIGLWFLNNKMNIPVERVTAANWVFQCSLFTFIINLISIPYNSTIVANEKMSAFAYISIFEALAKLLIVYALYISPFDKLKSYVSLLFILAAVVRLIYGNYCKRNFPEASYHFVCDKILLKKMTSFAGWNFFGQGACMMNSEGVNIVINLFFGVTINAARGIAMQVNNAVNQFVTNFMMALNPQITKSYASNNIQSMHILIFRGAKFSFFLMLLFLVPICLETKLILHIWLNIVPDYAVVFVQWTLVITAMNMLSNTLITALHATAKIKRYMIIVGLVELSNFPITYIAFKLGASPVYAYYIYFSVYLILMFLRLFLIKDLISLKAVVYIKEVYLKVLIVSVVAFIIPSVICLLQQDSIWRLVEICVVSFISTAFSIYLFGLNCSERSKIVSLLKNKLCVV